MILRYIYFQIVFLSILLFLLSSCSKSAEPAYDIFMQVSSIKLDGSSYSRQITYDSYGRVIAYQSLDGPLHLNVEYSYVSDDHVNIHAEELIIGQNGAYNILNTYEEDLHLEKGRADYSEGTVIRQTWDADPYEKKYRHDFIYTMDNHLNVMKITEWEKLEGKWNEETSSTWENYYVWEGVNLVEIEDYSGKYAPQRFYSYCYNSITGVQNILEIPMVYYHYYPFQLKEMFGPMSINLISERRISGENSLSVTSYDYDVSNGRIVSYSATSDNWTDTFTVQWTP